MRLIDIPNQKIINYFKRRFGIKDRKDEHVIILSKNPKNDSIVLGISSLWNSEDPFPVVDELEICKDYWDGEYWSSDNYQKSWKSFLLRNGVTK